jgi:CheY-like chemotaxis protein
MSSAFAKRPTILVVEDEGLILQDTSETLRDAGFSVLEAANAEEALARVEARPDIRLVFTDVNMPGRMDGLELARCVHRLHPAIRLILTSGKSEVAKEDIPDDGDFIAKPYSPESVTRAVSRLLA